MSKKVVKEITHDEWIRSLLPVVERQRPENSFTLEEAMQATNQKRTTMNRILAEKVDDGELEKRKFINNGRSGWLYTPKKKK